MIEKFTAEELEIIKRELGVTSSVNEKKKRYALMEDKERISNIFQEKIYGKKKDYSFVSPNKDVLSAIIVICDHFLMNYTESTCGGRLRRSSSIEGSVDAYKKLFNRIIDFLEEVKNG